MIGGSNENITCKVHYVWEVATVESEKVYKRTDAYANAFDIREGKEMSNLISWGVRT